MAEQPVDPQIGATLLRILHDLASRDSKGLETLTRFKQDPEAGAEGLTKYLRRRFDADNAFVQALAEAPGLPADLRTVVYGGQVERIVNIAQAGVVVLYPPPRRWLGFGFALVAMASVILGIILVVSSFRQRPSVAPTPSPTPQIEPVSGLKGVVYSMAQNPLSDDLWAFVYGKDCVYHFRLNEPPICSWNEDVALQTNVLAIFVRENGEVWFGTEGAGVAALVAGAATMSTDDDQWEAYTDTDGLVGLNVQAIAEDGRKSLWFGALEGLCRFNPTAKQWSYYHPKIGWRHDREELQGLPREDRLFEVHAIEVSEGGDVWAAISDGTGDALLRWSVDGLIGEAVRYSREAAQKDSCRIGKGVLRSLRFDRENRLWAGTSEGVISVLVEGGCWQSESIASDMAHTKLCVLSLLPLLDRERVLAGTVGDGLQVFNPSQRRWLEPLLPGRMVRALIFDQGEERVWIGTGEGLFLWTLHPVFSETRELVE